MVQGSVLSLVCGDEGDSSARFITEHVLVFRWLLTSSSVKPVFTVPIRSLNARSSCSDQCVIKSVSTKKHKRDHRKLHCEIHKLILKTDNLQVLNT